MGIAQKTGSIILRSSASLFLAQEDYRSVLEACIPSEEVRVHLVQSSIGKYALIQIIRNAPISLYEKASLMESLIPKENVLYDLLRNIERWRSARTGECFHPAKWAITDSFFFQRKMMREAIDAFEESGNVVFNLVEKWYDDELLDEKSSSGALFLSTQKALDYVRFDMQECEIDELSSAWYEVEEWTRNDDDLILRYTYTLIGDTPVFYRKHDRRGAKRTLESLSLDGPSGFLNIPLPYGTGDMVVVDCLPFAPSKPALIIEGPNWDSHFPTILSRNQRGKWTIDSLKWGCFSNGAAGRILALSPCYRLRACSESLDDDEEILHEVQGWLQSDPNRGSALWEAQYRADLHEMTSDDIRGLMGIAESSL